MVPEVPARVLLLRHGQSTWNAEGRWQGQADPPLSEHGRRQAWAAVATLGAPDALWSSDLSRAAETAAILAEGLGVGPVLADARLRERDAGAWTGLTRAEIEHRWPGALAERRRPAGWELDGPVVARLRDALGAVAASVPGGHAVCVTHGGAVRALARDLGLEPFEALANLEGLWVEVGPPVVRPGDRVRLVDAAVGGSAD